RRRGRTCNRERDHSTSESVQGRHCNSPVECEIRSTVYAGEVRRIRVDGETGATDCEGSCMSKIAFIPCTHSDFERFQPFHYWADRPIHKAARCSLVLVDGVER